MQNRLMTAVQEAILNAGQIDETGNVWLTNTDVVEALLEVAGFYASMHSFKGYTTLELAIKHVETLNHHINRFRVLRENGELKLKVVQRSEIN
jgi:hypothetical protein